MSILLCKVRYDKAKAYDSHGFLTSNSGNNGNANNPFTYTGREDVGLGLSYYRARYSHT
jgi:hypothetical protein